MKTYKSLILGVSALLMASCHPALFEDIDNAGIVVNKTENVAFNGNIVTVKKGTPLKFDIVGQPDNVTYFSGENGHQFAYHNVDKFDAADVESVSFSFRLCSRFGVFDQSAKGRLKVKYALGDDAETAFPGLKKDNFEEDSVLVESFAWLEMTSDEAIDISKVHNKPDEAKLFKMDIPKEWLDKKFTLAIVRNPEKEKAGAPAPDKEGNPSTVAQSTFEVKDMKLTTFMKNGTQYVNYASTFGFTPLNMDCKTTFEDLKENQYDLPLDLAYGSTQRDVSGYCNLSTIANGSFNIRGCAMGEPWRYTWLVSDYIDFFNRPVRDTGEKVKDLSQGLDKFEYIYQNVGTYKATFVINNENFDDAQGKLQEFVINVVE